jgi:D-tyrosyl-tRNA(Tyr) deacylase
LRAVVQRVVEARVVVGDEVVGEIGPGLCVLLGVAREDDETAAERLAAKVARLRIFENEDRSSTAASSTPAARRSSSATSRCSEIPKSERELDPTSQKQLRDRRLTASTGRSAPRWRH